MLKIYSLLFSVMVLGIISLGFYSNPQDDDQHPEVDWSIGCQECHAEVTPDVFTAWEASRHGDVNFGCYICHGDGAEEFFPQGSDATCSGCHSGYEEKMVENNNSSCYDCHNGHTLKFHNE